MTDTSSHSDIRIGSERSFGFVFAFVFAVIALWPIIFGSGSIRIWALLISVVCLILALVAPSALAAPNRLWFKFGLLLGRIITPIVMGLIFVLTVIPIGYLRRLRNPDPLNQMIDSDAETYWISRGQDDPPTSMFKQY